MPTKDVTAKLPEAIAAYVKASNAADMGAYLATFVDDPLINDIRREFWGRPAIKVWAEREIFGDNVAMEVLRAVEHYGDVILSAKFDGTYDKTGLPDPLILTLYFTFREGRMARLIILHKKPVSESVTVSA
jgi:ketosteroid isomerase-like protein